MLYLLIKLINISFSTPEVFPNGRRSCFSYNCKTYFKTEGKSKEKLQYMSFLEISNLIVDLTPLSDAIIVLYKRRLTVNHA